MRLNQRYKTFDTRFWKIFVPFLILFVFIVFLPAFITQNSWVRFDFTTTGEIGDTIGGIMGPFIAIAAAILTFLAFWVQFKANEQQRTDLKIERFENKFYELLQLHRANVTEMNIADKVVGRKCFVNMFYELKCIYKTAESIYNGISEQDRETYEYQNVRLMDFTYRIFFFGIGLHSEKHFTNSLKKAEEHLYSKVKPFLEKIQEQFTHAFDRKPERRYYTYGLPNNKIPNENTVEFYYFPFDGHANRLGHYYRHLFQTVSYITDQDYLDEEEKYSYIKTLRAQISNFEQLHIYYNALAWFDKEWKTFFTQYRFIKNLPLTLADFHRSPEEHFSKEIKELNEKGIAMFEWLE